MFAIWPTVILPSCFKASTEDNAYLWHCRYGHLSQKGLKLLNQKGMVRGLPALEQSSKVCGDCMNGKQHRESFPKQTTWRASHKLELIHADICGPIKPESNSKRRYFITFIDDYSRKTWVFFLSEKFAALETFKKFKIDVEAESGNTIKCLRTDRGGEFTSSEFNEFCSSNGIKRQLTAAYTPQQNGVCYLRRIYLKNFGLRQ